MVVALIISGCINEPNPAPVVAACNIVKRYQEGDPSIYGLYTYDSKGRISSYEQYQVGDRVWLESYEYNSQDRIVKKIHQTTPPPAANTYSETITCTYEYNSQGLATSYACSSNRFTSKSSGTSEYDASGNLIKSNHQQTQDDNVYTYVKVYEYKDGNCTKVVNNSGSSAETIVEYEYYLDRENTNTNAVQYLYGGAPSKNMLKKRTRTNRDGISTNDLYTYEFNEQGYPIKERVTYSLGYADGYQAHVNEYACQ